LKAFVKSIDALEDKKDRKNEKPINILRVELTLKPDWNSVISDMVVVSKPDHWNKPYTHKEYETKVKNTFDIKEARIHDCPVIQIGNSTAHQQKLVIRKINHPKFK